MNLSCPNIKDLPPPAYDAAQLREYLESINDSKSTYRGRMTTPESTPKVGIKLPPYTYSSQFDMVVKELLLAKSSEPGEGCIVDFMYVSPLLPMRYANTSSTCTNTLGSSLLLDSDLKPALNSESGTGIGGLAGAALHPLALGNVATFRRLLDIHPDTKDVLLIGVGGVEDREGVKRMKAVGAGAVACASALGRYGIGVFERMSG